jgi:hypothetical protein
VAGTQDCSLGFGTESTFRTAVTPTRWLEILGDESLDYKPVRKQGEGLRVGSRVARSGRRVTTSIDAGGDFTTECVSKGMGLLWQWLLGAGASSLVSGTTYQQVFTLGDTPASLTIQKGVVQAGGTVDAITFLGCMATGFELDFSNDEILKLKATVDAADVTTATGYTNPSYAASPVNLFQFAGGSIATGTLTAPTTSALASAATPLAGIRGGSLSVDHSLNVARKNMGGAGKKDKQLHGLSAITGKIDAEYISTSFRDAYLADSPMALVLNWITPGTLSTGVETLQVVLPEVKFDSELVKMGGADLSIQGMEFTVLDNLTAAQPIWVVTRTADLAL